MKKTLLLISAAPLLLLQACGGGGGGGDNPNPPNPGDFNAFFQPGSAARFMLVSPTGLSSGTLTSNNTRQAADGAMTMLGGNQLTGNYTVQDIAGHASFATGRWTKGSVALGTGTDILTGTDGRAYHYIAYRGVSALPSYDIFCRDGTFTIPTYTGGGNRAALTGTSAGGSVGIVFGDGSGELSGFAIIRVDANGEYASTFPYPKQKIDSPSSMISTGFSDSGSSFAAQLIDGGGISFGSLSPNVYALAIAYSVVMPSGARYIGTGRLDCGQWVSR
jgi:hypothetical protein